MIWLYPWLLSHNKQFLTGLLSRLNFSISKQIRACLQHDPHSPGWNRVCADGVTSVHWDIKMLGDWQRAGSVTLLGNRKSSLAPVSPPSRWNIYRVHTHSSVVITEPLLCASFCLAVRRVGMHNQSGNQSSKQLQWPVWRLNGGYEKLVVGFAGQLRCRLRTQRDERDEEVGAEVCRADRHLPRWVTPNLGLHIARFGT